MLASKMRIVNGRVITKDESDPNQSDIEAAQRGNNMIGMSLADLEDLIRLMEGKSTFAAKVTILAAKQMIAAKKRAGARDSKVKDEEYFNGIHIGKGKILYEKGGYVIAQYGNGILLKSSKGASVAVATLEDGKRRIEKAIQAGGLYADSKTKDDSLDEMIRKMAREKADVPFNDDGTIRTPQQAQLSYEQWYKILKSRYKNDSRYAVEYGDSKTKDDYPDVDPARVLEIENTIKSLFISINPSQVKEISNSVTSKKMAVKKGLSMGLKLSPEGMEFKDSKTKDVVLVNGYEIRPSPESRTWVVMKDGDVIKRFNDYESAYRFAKGDSKDAYEATKPKNIAAAKNLSVAQGKAASDRKTK